MLRDNKETIIIPRLNIFPNSRSQKFDADQNALHEAIELKYFVSGKSTLMVGNRTIEAVAGDIVVVNPYEFHATLDCGSPEGIYHLLIVPLEYFSADGADDLNLKQMLIERRIRLANHIQGEIAISSCFLRIIKENKEKNKYHHMLIRSLLLEMFALMLRENHEDQEYEDVVALQSYQTIEPALRYVRDHYAVDISVDGLAKLCGLSKHYFCRLFKSIIKKTVMEYVREYRLKVAYSLLENTTKSVARIAEECGFVDDNYFCRCFKKHYGISPGRYRKERAESQNN